MNSLITDFKSNLQNSLISLKEDLKSIRTGRANPAMIESLEVETYGGSTKLRLKELSTMTTEGASTIIIVPFDPSTSNDIERAILKSPLGISPQNETTKILVRIPPLSAEQREKMVKMVSGKIEEKRVIVRNQRDDVRKKIRNQFELKEISEDEKFRMEKEIDSVMQKINSEIEMVKDSKEQEIRAV